MEGVENLSHAVGVFRANEDPSKLAMRTFETKRQPANDHHTIAHRLSGIQFPEAGEYLIKVVVAAGDTLSTFIRKLSVEHAPNGP
jgi:hypothetical protein